MTGAEIEAALSYELCDRLETTCIKLEETVGEILLEPAGGLIKMIGDTDNELLVVGAVGQGANPLMTLRESGGDELAVAVDGTKTGFTADEMWFTIGGTVYYMTAAGFSAAGGSRFLVRHAVGSATTPMYSTGSDSDTGFYALTDQAAITVGGSNKLDARPTYAEFMGCRYYEPSAAAPATCDGSAACDRYYDTSTNTFCGCDGTSWIDTDGNGGVCA